MKNNYPIKYALMPIYEQVGWIHGLNELEREYGIVCYIVAKCYLIDEVKKYHQDGKEEIIYHVVFPYQKYDFDTYNIEEPRYNFNTGACSNSTKVKLVFDDFYTATNAKEQKNEEILLDELSCLSFEKYEEQVDKIECEYAKRINYYNQLEKMIEKQTSYLQVNNINKKQSIIVSSKDGVEEKYYSLYYYIKLFKDENFIAYSVTDKEYLNILNNVNKIDSYNENLLLINDKKSGITKIIGENDEKYLSDQGVTSTTNNYEDPVSFSYVIYTMENYEDILNSFHYNEKVIKLSK